jgi:hypothetical protein
MKSKYSLRACLIAAGLVSAQALALAQTELFWTGTTGGLFDATKWNPSQIPDLTEIVTINNGGTATIAADAGTRSLSGIRLGSTQNSSESGQRHAVHVHPERRHDLLRRPGPVSGQLLGRRLERP